MRGRAAKRPAAGARQAQPEKIGVRHGVLGPWVFKVINAGNVESMELACRNATEEPSEANLVKLLDLWSAGWKHRGRTRAVGPGAYERYATLGLFGHGGVVGVSNATGLREACIAVNRFLRTRFPDGTWSSIAVLFNPRMGLHRDIQNMPGHSNHALALGEYTGGRVWIEDDEGDSPAWLEDKKGGRELRGRWLDMHDKPVSFDARRYHKVEPHEGSMWALAAYVPSSLCSGDGAAPASAERSGLPVACVKLIAGKREHFLGRWGKVGIPTSHPEACRTLTCIRRGVRKSPLIRPAGFARGSVPRPACRGPHLYPKVRPEIAFDPSRRFCLAFRPESVGGWGCVQTDTTGRSVPRPAEALTCIRRCARKSPLTAFRPATGQVVRLGCVDVLDLIIPSASTQTS